MSELAYNNSSGALDQLLRLERLGARISYSPDTISTLSNGITYYEVGVTSNDGAQYIIQAYDEEATQLFVQSQKMKINSPLIVASR